MSQGFRFLDARLPDVLGPGNESTLAGVFILRAEIDLAVGLETDVLPYTMDPFSQSNR